MNVFVAKEMMESLVEAHQALQRAEKNAKKIEGKEEYLAFMKTLLNAIAELEDGPMLEILKEHPALSPFPSVGKK